MSGEAKKLSPFAVPVLIVLVCAGVSFGANLLYGEKRSIEWMVELFFKLAIPALLIGWLAKKLGGGGDPH